MGFASLGLTTICSAQMVYHLFITGSTLDLDQMIYANLWRYYQRTII